MEESDTTYHPSRNGNIPKKDEWPEERLIELWNRRRMAVERKISWRKFVDTHYPGESLSGVRFKYYDIRDKLQRDSGRRHSDRLAYLDSVSTSSSGSSVISLSDHESYTGAVIEPAVVKDGTQQTRPKRTRSSSDCQNDQRKKGTQTYAYPVSPQKVARSELKSQAIVDQNSILETPNLPTTSPQTAGHKYGYHPPATSSLTETESDESAIRMSRLTPQNWQYILTQAQACDSERERLEQMQRQLKNTTGRLAEAEAELEEMRKIPSKQIETHRAPTVGNKLERQGSLEDLKMVASELRKACSQFQTRSKESMAPVIWISSKTQDAVKSVEQKLEELDKVIQTCCQT